MVFEIMPPDLFIVIVLIASAILFNESVKHYKTNHQLTKLLQFLLMSLGGVTASVWKYLEVYVDINEMVINIVKSLSFFLIALGVLSGMVNVFKYENKNQKKIAKIALAYIVFLSIVFFIIIYFK